MKKVTLAIMLTVTLALSGCVAENKAHTEAEQKVTCTVECKVEEWNHSTEVTVPEGASALDVLEEACEEWDKDITTTGVGITAYVTSIDGTKAGDHGPESGWMYSVNGEAPDKGAAQYETKEGDTILWYYITSYSEMQ